MARPSTLALEWNNYRLYAVTGAFLAAAVGVPYLFHQIHLAGPAFLPMHFFVLLAGLSFGWRSGLLVGVSSPTLGFVLSGLPLPALVPFMTAELATYGLVMGLLKERTHFNRWLALGLALIAGRVALLALRAIFTPAPLTLVWEATLVGWPGIAIQLALVPPLSRWLERVVRG